MCSDPLRVTLVAGQRIGRRQYRQMLVARQLPDVLHLSGGAAAIIDGEAICVLRCALARDWIEKPVWIRRHVVSLASEHMPLAPHQGLCRAQKSLARIVRDG